MKIYDHENIYTLFRNVIKRVREVNHKKIIKKEIKDLHEI